MVGTLSVYEIEYANPCNGKNMPVMFRTDYDEEVVKLLDAVGPKPCPPPRFGSPRCGKQELSQYIVRLILIAYCP